MELKILHLYPDALNMYGDRGNVLCLKKRLNWRGIECTVDGVSVDMELDETKYDMILIGGGQELSESPFHQDILSKAPALRRAVENGTVVLAIAGGYQLLGRYYETAEGKQLPLVGALDVYTVAGKERLSGNCLYELEEGFNLVAFENHLGKTYLGEGVRPLGKVAVGFGNNGEDGTEGVRYKNVFCSYGHGCLLPKNPELADLLLQIALERKYPGVTLNPLDDTLEQNAHHYMEARLRAT